MTTPTTPKKGQANNHSFSSHLTNVFENPSHHSNSEANGTNSLDKAARLLGELPYVANASKGNRHKLTQLLGMGKTSEASEAPKSTNGQNENSISKTSLLGNDQLASHASYGSTNIAASKPTAENVTSPTDGRLISYQQKREPHHDDSATSSVSRLNNNVEDRATSSRPPSRAPSNVTFCLDSRPTSRTAFTTADTKTDDDSPKDKCCPGCSIM